MIIYSDMILYYKFNQNILYHLNQFTHFKDEYNTKPKCKYYQNCISFTRLSNGGNRFDDKCPIKLYNHPPTNNNKQYQPNYGYIKALVN